MQPQGSARQKRGVSEIVSTVLIIAITIAAIGIIAAWIVPMIRNNIGSNVCSDVDVTIVSSGGYTCYEPNGITTVQIKKGNENVTVSGLKFYLSSGGNSVKYTKQIVLSNNGLSVFNLNSSNISQLDKIGVVPIVKSGSSSKECVAVYLEQIPVCSIGEAVFGEILNETNETCVVNCSCAANTLVGQTCDDGCEGVCVGTMVPAIQDGTQAYPFLINNWTDLNKVRNNLDKSFILITNLNSSSTDYSTRGDSWISIGGTFSGNFNGNGKTISDLRGQPFFYSLSGTVANLGLDNISVDGPLISATGGLAMMSSGTISNCYVKGRVFSSVDIPFNNAGGLVGNQSGGIISSSYFIGNVSNGFGSSVGGLVGNQSGGVISNSYSVGNVTGSGNYIGGLVGQSKGTISNSYSSGNATGNNYVGGLVGYVDGVINRSYSTSYVKGFWRVGGLVGEQFSGAINDAYAAGRVNASGNFTGGLVGKQSNAAKVYTSYSIGNVTSSLVGANVGGLVGYNDAGASAIGSFWDNQTSGRSTSAGGAGAMGKTTTEMKTPSTFNLWDPNVWVFQAGQYPKLK
jgi:flagellin-like protein